MIKKLLIIGFGSIGRKYHDLIRNNYNKIDLRVLRTKLKKKEKNINFFFNLNDAIKFNPDTVLICSSADKHYFYLKKFESENRKILIEKPIFDRLKKFSLNKLPKNKILVGYFLRFHPLVLHLKKLVDKNYKKIFYTRIQAGHNLKYWRKTRNYRSTVSASKKTAGGVLFELSHEIDLASFLFGIPKKVFCTTAKYSNLDINVEDFAEFQLIYPKKNISVNLNFIEESYNRNIRVLFFGGFIECDFSTGIIKYYKNKKIYVKKFDEDFKDIYLKQINYLCNEEIFTDKNFSTFDSAISVLKIIEKLKISNEKKKIVRV